MVFGSLNFEVAIRHDDEYLPNTDVHLLSLHAEFVCKAARIYFKNSTKISLKMCKNMCTFMIKYHIVFLEQCID